MISEKLVARGLVIKLLLVGWLLNRRFPDSRGTTIQGAGSADDGVYRIDLKAQRSNPVQDAAPGALPQWIPPQLTQLVETAPSGSKWLHEIKLDGFRMAGRIERGQTKLLTRTGLAALAGIAAIGRGTNYNPGYARNKRIQASVYFSWPLAAKCWPS
jgi:hypothetical protein